MILFVDDEHKQLDPWVAALVNAGYRCYPVDNPDEAMEALRAHRSICGAVVDIMLPVGTMDFDLTDAGLRTGLALIEELQRIRPGLPVVVLSLRRDCMERIQALKAEFVSKTLDEPGDLLAAVQRLGMVPDGGAVQ